MDVDRIDSDGTSADPPPRPRVEAAHAPAEMRELLGIEEFQRWDLRVGRVIEAGPHPRADRLLKLRVDLGGEERPLVAGIAAQYRPEDLVGRLIVVVVNLKPARLRGEESCGMLLAASSGEVVSLLVPDRDVAPGAQVR
jgi:methionine--tRNA ligase beta chain